MTDEQLALETKMRGITSELTKEEGRKLLEILLERTSVDDIAEAITKVKLYMEANKIGSKIMDF